MKFSIICVNYNGGARIQRCMAALAGQTNADFEVFMVDNGSSDGSDNTPVPDARFKWIKAGKNLGFAAGNNLAAREAKGDWIFLINPDAYAEPECLQTFLEAMRRHPDCVLFGCTQLNDRVPELLDGAGDCYLAIGIPWRGGEGWGVENLPDEGTVFGPCGAAYLVRRDVFLEHGGFDEDFFCYCEDVDLNFRLRLAGHYAVQVAEAFVRHEGSALTGIKSHFSLYHGTRNRLWVFVKNMPCVLFYPLLPFHIALTVLSLANPKYFKSRWEGLRDGVKALPAVWNKRMQIQKARKATPWQIAKALSWNPLDFVWRKADVRK